MLIGYFDFFILAVLVFLNIKFWKRGIKLKGRFILGFLLFGFILPVISMIVEVQRVDRTIGIIDNFEVFYTYLRFPTYWVFGMAQIFLIIMKNLSKIKTNSKQ